jgi:isoquinoline 1-oxidoreductase subunit beta
MISEILNLGEKPQKLPIISRRNLLIGGGVGAGLLVAWSLWPREYPVNLAAAKGEHVINGFIKLGEDGHIVVVAPTVEMGQGAYTQIAQLVADEIGADWRQIAVEAAPINPLYANRLLAREWADGMGTWLFGDVARDLAESRATSNALQITGNSSTVRSFGVQARMAGAAARTLLTMAAAKQWDTDWQACETLNGFVVFGKNRARFGELAAQAATLSLPDEFQLRVGAQDRLVGQNLPRLDVPSKIDGSANFAADIRLPNMVYASIAMGPLGDSVVSSVDEAKAKARPDFVQLVKTQRWVAVLAKTWWAAEQALKAANPRFTSNGKLPSSAEAQNALRVALQSADSVTMASKGEFDDAYPAEATLKSGYSVDLSPHAAIEPIAATAYVNEGKLELWIGTQVPGLARKAAAQASGYDEADIIVHPMQIGGSFGRKYEVEVAAQVAQLVVETERPVQLIWSRHMDMLHDRFRPMASAQMTAHLKAGGLVDGWRAQIAAPAALAEMKSRIMDGTLPHDAVAGQANGSDASIVAGSYPPYAIPNLDIQVHPVNIGIATGKWRSGAHSYTAFFNECFMDEIARKSGIEPFSFRMALLGGNPRLAMCLTKVTALAGWDGGGDGSRMGIACHSMLGAHIAVIAEASISDDQRVIVQKLSAAVDVGRVVNPDITRQQIEGGLMFGLAAAAANRVVVDKGMVTPSHLGGLRLPRLVDTPPIMIDMILSDEPPGGVGEVAVPPVAPAIANALFAASGKRFRQLPLNPANL